MSATTSAVPRSAIMNFVRRLHFYIGLFIAPFIFIAALTGTLYVLTPQFENWFYHSALTVQPEGEAKPLADQIAAARSRVGEQQRIYAIRPAPGPNDTTRVQFVEPDLGASKSRSVFVDPYTLRITGDMPVYGTTGVLPIRTWLDDLHRGLLLGDIGRNYSELAASWLWVAAVGGGILWLTSRRKPKPAQASAGFSFARHWHITLGLVLSVGLIFFSITGLTWSQWAGGNIDRWRADLNWLTPQVRTALDGQSVAVNDPHADHHAAPSAMADMDMGDMEMSGMAMPMAAAKVPVVQVNADNGDWQRVLQAARAAGIDAAKVELRQPKSTGQAWTVTEVDRHWPSHVDSASIAPNDFHLVDHVRFADFPLVAKLTRWGVDAHMGILFGLPNQLLLAAFGLGLCTLILMGYRMWWLRRPAVATQNPVETLLASWLALPLPAKAVVLLLALGLSYALPVMGISLLAFVLTDIVRWRSSQRVTQPQTVIAPEQQSPLAIVQLRIAAKRKELRKFLYAVAVLAVIVASVMGNAIIGGVIDEYHLTLSHWTVGMYLTQGFMIVLYTGVFTGLMSIPLWYFFLGESDEQGK
ncbi:DUF2534 family protein [Pantoea sp. A4]|uniref:DUF2534 family protein n=1 Tax=Pantoea sp. A4 TaxID=1225184 RepID=UPI0003799B4F|nr:DUF2534 family protein [Pantoea sp. A4]